MFYTDMPTLPPFSQLLRHQNNEDDEWHERGLLPPTAQSPPSPPAHSLPSFRNLYEDPPTSRSYPSDSYRYGTRPIEIQPLAPRPDFHYQRQIPDAVIDPALREQDTSRARGFYNEERPPRYIQGRSAVARGLKPVMLLPMVLPREPSSAYPQVVERHYNPHHFNFCPGAEASSATRPLMGVQIGNKADVQPTYERNNEHYSMERYGARDGVQHDVYEGDEWHRHQRTQFPPRFSTRAASNPMDFEGYRYPPMRPHTPLNTTASSATTSSSHSPIACPPDVLEVDGHSPYSHTPPPTSSRLSQASDEISSQPSQGPTHTGTYTKDASHSGQKRKREENESRKGTHVRHRRAGVGVESASGGDPEESMGQSSQKNTVTSNTVTGVADSSTVKSTAESATGSEKKLTKSRTEASTTTTKSSSTAEGTNTRKRKGGQKRGSLRREWTGPEPPQPLPPLLDYRRARRSAKGKTGVREPWRVDIAASETQQQAAGPVVVQNEGNANEEPTNNFDSSKSRVVDDSRAAKETKATKEAKTQLACASAGRTAAAAIFNFHTVDVFSSLPPMIFNKL
ncbi:hypothetical protein EYR38_009116 [Pleurotus pulmonarius]|nr:hypothetical protein EYR38_009116 [Pleurotus pulmonarius]